MDRWWIAVTHPLNERRATRGLEELGRAAWWPVRQVEIVNRHTRGLRVKPVREYPLFPGYIFVRCIGSHHDLDVVDGLRGLLCNEWKPLTVSDDEVLRVREYAHDLELERRLQFEPYQVGQPVIVVHGPMEGHAGPIEFVRRDAATILFDIMGRPTPVTVPMKDLRKAA